MILDNTIWGVSMHLHAFASQPHDTVSDCVIHHGSRKRILIFLCEAKRGTSELTCTIGSFTHVDECSRAKAQENPSEPCMAKQVSVAGSESAVQ
jgi:hypothetical protein